MLTWLLSPPANDPFHLSQLHIILNQTDKLLEDYANGLQNGDFSPDQAKYVASCDDRHRVD